MAGRSTLHPVTILRRHPVAVAVVVAILARLPALTRPLRADEAGFLLVARAWDPRPDSPYGAYWVDRPPPLVAAFRGIDWLGGAVALRLVGALVAGLSVLLAAALARQVAGSRAAAWAAGIAAALLANPMIDVVAVKGELLAVPLILGSMLLTLHAVRRRSAWLAIAAGVAGAAAVGLKQNLATALVFAVVLLVVAALTGRLPRRTALGLAVAGLVGAVVPVAAVALWAHAEGVRLSAVWYATYGFRSDAARVIADGVSDAPQRRAWLLLAIALGTGLLLVLGGLLAHLRTLWRDDPPVVGATLAVVVFDVVALVAGGSYWQDYLTPLVPGAVLCVALVAERVERPGRIMRRLVVAAGVSAAAAMAFWLVWNATGQQEFDEAHTGDALADAAAPDDTLVVFGGRADLQDASGMSSPYPYLWSLPMRTRDPGYADLTELLAGPDAPTWLVEWVSFDAWTDAGVADLEQTVEQRYVERGTACNGHPIYLLRGVDRPVVEPICD